MLRNVKFQIQLEKRKLEKLFATCIVLGRLCIGKHFIAKSLFLLLHVTTVCCCFLLYVWNT